MVFDRIKREENCHGRVECVGKGNVCDCGCDE